MASSRQDVVQSAERLVARGRLDAAIEEYRKVLEASPNDTSTLNRVGDLYARLNRPHKATELFRQTAENFSRQGFFVKAIAIYKKIIRLDPSQIAAYENLADLYHKQGLSNDAEAQYQVVADYYVKHGDQRAAVNVYRSMVAIEATNPSYRLRLAGLFQELGDTPGALEQYEQIARLMLEHGRAEEAAQVYTSALDLGPPSPEFVARAVRALREAGHGPGADRVLRLAGERQPSAAAVAKSLLAREGEGVVVAASPPARAPSWLVEAEVEQPAAELIEPAEREAVALVPGGAAIEEEAPAAAPLEAEAEEEVLLDLDGDDLAAGSLAELIAEAAREVVEEEPIATALTAEVEAAAEFDFELEVEEIAEPEAPVPEAPVAELEAPVAEAAAPLSEPAFFVADARPLEIALKIDRLLLDAEVLTRYQMEELAVAALEQVLELDADHVDALGRLIDLELTLGRRDEALAMASRFAQLSERSGQPVVWERVVGRMLEAGFLHEEGRFVAVAPPPVELATEPSVAEPAAEEIAIDLAPAVAPEPVEAVVEEVVVEEVVVEEVVVEEVVVEEMVFEEPVAAAPEPLAAEPAVEGPSEPAVERSVVPGVEVPEDLMVRWRREIAPRLGALVDAAELEQRTAPAPPPTSPAAPIDLSSLAEELLAEIEGAAAAPPPSLPPLAAPPAAPWQEPVPPLERSGADVFFDLATELEAELLGEDFGEDLLPPVQEQTIEEIVEGFRRGMEKSLSPEDFDTHYNLGIAYQEMGLIDEAIGEFQLAAKDSRYLVECCSLLAACFQEKGYPELAVHWYERGLDSPSLQDEERLGLLYELGSLELALDERESARRRFVEIYGRSSTYRDVLAKLEELGRPQS